MSDEVETGYKIKGPINDNISGRKNKKAANGSIALIKELVTREKTGIYLDQASVKWVSTSTDYILNDVNVNVGPTQLVSVIGPVGSGKTTLLHVIMKELSLLNGTLDV